MPEATAGIDFAAVFVRAERRRIPWRRVRLKNRLSFLV